MAGPITEALKGSRLAVEVGGDAARASADDWQALAAAYDRTVRDPIAYAATVRFTGTGSPAVTDPAAFRALHALAWRLNRYPKPNVALLDGSAAGLVNALTLHGTHQVAAAGYRFRAVEVGVPAPPAYGITHRLARLPPGWGTYIGLGVAEVGPARAHALGLVTHLIEADAFDTIESHVAAADPVDPVLDRLHGRPRPAAGEPERIVAAFTGPTIEIMLESLEHIGTEASRAAHGQLARLDPVLGAWVLALIAQARDLDFNATLVRDERIGRRLLVARAGGGVSLPRDRAERDALSRPGSDDIALAELYPIPPPLT